MLAIVLAAGVSHLVSHDTVYTRKLLRRGIDIDEPADAALRRAPVSAYMTPPPEPVPATLTLQQAAAHFVRSDNSHLPVVDDDGAFLGVLASHDVMTALAGGDPAPVRALVNPVDPLQPDSSLGEALQRLEHGDGAVPVTDTSQTVVGWVRHRDLLSAMSVRTTSEPRPGSVRTSSTPPPQQRRKHQSWMTQAHTRSS